MLTAMFNEFRVRVREHCQKSSLLYFVVMGLVWFLIIFLITGFLSSGESFFNILFEDSSDVFMDYYNSIMYSSDDPYTYWHVIYPPLITLFYATIGKYTIPYITNSDLELSFALRESQLGIMSYLTITVISLMVLYFLIQKFLINKYSIFKINLLFLCILLSYPVIFTIERGNSILYALIFCLIFLLCYRSDKKLLRYIAYASLGVATGIKLYPIFFAMLILKDGRYREFISCIFINLLIFLIPFVFTDGNVAILLDTVFNHADSVSSHAGFDNITSVLFYFCGSFLSADILNLFGKIISLFLLLITFLIVIFKKNVSEWQCILMIVLNIILGFSVPTGYLCLYLILPLLVMLRDESCICKKNMFYASLIVFVISVFTIYGVPRSAMGYLRNIAMFVMFFTSIVFCLFNSSAHSYNVKSDGCFFKRINFTDIHPVIPVLYVFSIIISTWSMVPLNIEYIPGTLSINYVVFLLHEFSFIGIDLFVVLSYFLIHRLFINFSSSKEYYINSFKYLVTINTISSILCYFLISNYQFVEFIGNILMVGFWFDLSNQFFLVQLLFLTILIMPVFNKFFTNVNEKLNIILLTVIFLLFFIVVPSGYTLFVYTIELLICTSLYMCCSKIKSISCGLKLSLYCILWGVSLFIFWVGSMPGLWEELCVQFKLNRLMPFLVLPGAIVLFSEIIDLISCDYSKQICLFFKKCNEYKIGMCIFQLLSLTLIYECELFTLFLPLFVIVIFTCMGILYEYLFYRLSKRYVCHKHGHTYKL